MIKKLAAILFLIAGVANAQDIKPAPCNIAGGTITCPSGSLTPGTGSGTVTSVAVTTANGVSGVVANPTTTPAVTITLGAITPSSVSVGSGSAITSSGPGGILTSLGYTTPGTGVTTALGINIGSAGAPVLFNGAGGTPSSLVGTNITGTAAGLTAGNVTTNANLTGDMTSIGNVTTLAWITRAASQTLAIGAGGTLGSNAFTSTAYLPLAGGTLSGTLVASDGGTWSSSGVSLSAGAVGTPSIFFGSDTTTGWYRPGANQWAFSGGGALKFDYGLTSVNNFNYAANVNNSLGSFLVSSVAGQGFYFRSGASGLTSPANNTIQVGTNDVASGASAQTVTCQGNTGSTTNGPLCTFRGAGGGSSTSVGGELRLSGGLSSAAAGTGGDITGFTAPAAAGNAAVERFRAYTTGGFRVGVAALTLTGGALGLDKITASASAPGAGGSKLEIVCGTAAGSAKLVMYAGTSGTATTIIDSVGSGVTGC